MSDVKIPIFSTVFEIGQDKELVVPSNGKPYIRHYSYNEDSMRLWSKGLDALRDPKFLRAYSRGMNTDHKIGRPKGSKLDLGIRYRVYVALWAAMTSLEIEGDFVECGVNTGITSLAILDFIGETPFKNRHYYLFDTFEGIPESQMTAAEEQIAKNKNTRFYEDCFEQVKETFREYDFVQIVKGAVPDTLFDLDISDVCFLHIDMNIVYPEVEALRYFWNRLVPGAVVLFDDYGWNGHRPQRLALDQLASELGTRILEMPTGQGLIFKRR